MLEESQTPTSHHVGGEDNGCAVQLQQVEAEHEKTGYGHTTPVTPEAMEALEEAPSHSPTGADAPVRPATRNPSECVGFTQARFWWKKAERLAGLQPKRGRGWHSLRRKFASDLMDLPLKVLCELGGWKAAQTVLRCYQRPHEDRLRKAIEKYRGVGSASN